MKYTKARDLSFRVTACRGQKRGILSFLRDHGVLSKDIAIAAGIADPTRVVYHLLDEGYDIAITTLKTLPGRQGGTWYELGS